MPRPRTLHDEYFKKAKEEGYAARSAYKLKQIQEKKGVLRRGDRVLDLGCAPGSWLQVASELIGPGKGVVVGLDLKPVTITLPPNAFAIVGDAFKANADELLATAGDTARLAGFDVILSDMAPNTEGSAGGSGDHFRSIELCRRVLDLVPHVLRPGGNLVMKVFEGEAYPDLLKDTERVFEDAKGYKPAASRDVSREMYIVAKGYRPRDTRPPRAASERTAEERARGPVVAPTRPAPGAGWGGGGGGGGNR